MPDNIEESLVALMPDRFWEAYGVLCEVLYWGDAEPAIGNVKRGSRAGSYSFRRPELLEGKAMVDSWLSATSQNLRRYEAKRRREAHQRSRPHSNVAASRAVRPRTHAGDDKKEKG
jgi:hypothetical protein